MIDNPQENLSNYRSKSYKILKFKIWIIMWLVFGIGFLIAGIVATITTFTIMGVTFLTWCIIISVIFCSCRHTEAIEDDLYCRILRQGACIPYDYSSTLNKVSLYEDYKSLNNFDLKIKQILKENNKCHLCLNEYRWYSHKIILPCYHIFHSRCILRYIKNNKTENATNTYMCPECPTEQNSYDTKEYYII